MKTFLRVWLGIGLISMGIGIGLLIIAFASGARWEDTSSFISINKSYEGVEKLDFDIPYGEVKIIKGNGFSITAKNILEGEMESYVKNGVWHIHQEKSQFSNYFGIDIPMRKLIYWGDHFSPDITITLPEDFTAKDVTFKIGAGKATVDQVKANVGNFEVGAGRIQIDNLSINEKSYYKVGTGEMVLNNISVSNATIDCGIGNMNIDGAITGNNNIKCGIGNIELNLDGSKDDYSYEVNSGIGEVEINGENYHNLSNKIISNQNADNKIYLDCGIGHISIDFQ